MFIIDWKKKTIYSELTYLLVVHCYRFLAIYFNKLNICAHMRFCKHLLDLLKLSVHN